jgi:Na+/phosphate symporter
MKDHRVMVNPFRILSPKLDSAAAKFEDLHKEPVSESVSPDEGMLIMMSKIIEMNKLVAKAIASGDEKPLTRCDELAAEVHKIEALLTKNLLGSASMIGQNLFRIVVRFPGRFERIGDMFTNIVACCRIKNREGIPFSDKAKEDLAGIFALLNDILTNIRDSLVVHNKALIEHLESQRKTLDQMLSDARFGHWDRLEKGFCAPQASTLYLEIMDSFGAVDRYIGKMAESLAALQDVDEAPEQQ